MRIAFFWEVRQLLDNLHRQGVINWETREALINRGAAWVRQHAEGEIDVVNVDEQKYFAHLLEGQSEDVKQRFQEQFSSKAGETRA